MDAGADVKVESGDEVEGYDVVGLRHLNILCFYENATPTRGTAHATKNQSMLRCSRHAIRSQ